MKVKKHMLLFLIAYTPLLGAWSPSADENRVTENYLGAETTAESAHTIESTEFKDQDSSKVSSSNQTEDTKE